MNDIEKKAMDIQEKFELYLVSLTFTFLALSVQTASFGTHSTGDALELIGWILLFISGITGIFRLALVPVVLRYYAAKELGENVDEEDLTKVEAKISSRKSLWLFVAGLAVIILARSAPPLAQAIKFLCQQI